MTEDMTVSRVNKRNNA